MKREITSHHYVRPSYCESVHGYFDNRKNRKCNGSKSKKVLPTALPIKIDGVIINGKVFYKRSLDNFVLKKKGTIYLSTSSTSTGAHDNLLTEKNVFSNSSIQISASFIFFQVVKYLVENGADIRKPNINGGTCLINSVQSVDLCKFLIEKNADVNAQDNSGESFFFNHESLKIIM